MLENSWKELLNVNVSTLTSIGVRKHSELELPLVHSPTARVPYLTETYNYWPSAITEEPPLVGRSLLCLLRGVPPPLCVCPSAWRPVLRDVIECHLQQE